MSRSALPVKKMLSYFSFHIKQSRFKYTVNYEKIKIYLINSYYRIGIFQILSIFLVDIIMWIPEYLLNVNDLWAGIPGDSTAYEIPVPTILCRHLLQAGESGDGHGNASAVIKIHLKSSAFGERDCLDFWDYAPVSFYFHHSQRYGIYISYLTEIKGFYKFFEFILLNTT